MLKIMLGSLKQCGVVTLAVAMGKFDRNKYYIMLCTSLNTVGKSIINKASDPLIYWVSYYKN